MNTNPKDLILGIMINSEDQRLYLKDRINPELFLENDLKNIAHFLKANVFSWEGLMKSHGKSAVLRAMDLSSLAEKISFYQNRRKKDERK